MSLVAAWRLRRYRRIAAATRLAVAVLSIDLTLVNSPLYDLSPFGDSKTAALRENCVFCR
jgi:hypothetical protein